MQWKAPRGCAACAGPLAPIGAVALVPHRRTTRVRFRIKERCVNDTGPVSDGFVARPVTLNAWIDTHGISAQTIEDARPHASEFKRVASDLGNRRAIALAHAGEGRIALLEDDDDRAESLLQQALEDLQEHPWLTDQADAIEALAAVAAHGRRWKRCVRLLAAVATWRSSRGLVRAPVQDDLWTAILDAARAALGEQVFTDTWRQATTLTLDQAIDLARRRRGRRDRPLTGCASLTPAELRVAELAAAGLSNPEIGERLFITRGTAKVHLSRVYTKLAINNRTELAAKWANRDNPPRRSKAVPGD